jgi:hypothetical protein
VAALADLIDQTLRGSAAADAGRRDAGLAVAARYTWEASAGEHVAAYRRALS